MTYSDIHFGKIIHLDMPQKQGIIKNFNDKEIPFRFVAVREEVAKGNLVGFRLSPTRHFKARYEATHIQRAYTSKDKRPILDRRDSHLHLGVQPYLKTACAQIICDKKKTIRVQVNFKSIIGESICVPTDDDDEIVYIVREGRFGYSRFVLSKSPIPTKSLTIVLKKTRHYYRILTAYIGKKAEAEPWERRATARSWTFWNNHAFVYGIEPVKEQTLRTDCPWTKRN